MLSIDGLALFSRNCCRILKMIDQTLCSLLTCFDYTSTAVYPRVELYGTNTFSHEMKLDESPF